MLTPEQMGLLGAALLTKQDGRVLSIADSNLSNAQALEADGHVRLWHTGLFWVIAPTETGQQVSTKYEAALSPIQFSADSAGYAADLTDEQRMIIAHDGVPTKPAPRMWGDHESSERQAEYEQRIGYKLSPLGNYVYCGPKIQGNPEHFVMHKLVRPVQQERDKFGDDKSTVDDVPIK